jgi:hypothetical protein
LEQLDVGNSHFISAKPKKMPECWGNVVDTIYMHLCMHIYTDRLGADFHDTARSLCPFLLDKLKDKNKGVVETTHAALDCMIE